MFLTKYIFYAAIFAASSTTVFADVVEGVWKSAPDVNGLVVHVRAKPCGPALCGTVERAKAALCGRACPVGRHRGV